MKRAVLIAGLVLCLGTAVLLGFAFQGGNRARLPKSSLAGATTRAGTATAPVTTVPPLTVPCNAELNVAPAKALFRVMGRCHVSTDGPAQCNASGGDDFGADYAITTTSGYAAYLSLGIEGYKGFGVYKSADVTFFVLYGFHLAQWQAPSTAITITAHSVVLPRTVLNAAPGTGATSMLTAQGTLPCAAA